MPFLPGAADEERPCHGTISTGLLRQLRAGRLTAAAWSRYGHLLDHPLEDPTARDLQRYARGLAVLLYDESARCIQEYLRICATEERARPGADAPGAWQLWGLKEGHNASVWKVTSRLGGEGRGATFVVNVARDREAGAELTRTATLMAAVTARDPELPVARVLDQRDVRLRTWAGVVEVHVVRTEWIDGAEIHAMRDPHREGRDYIAVERFLTAPDDPLRIAALRGRRLTAQEVAVLEREVSDCLRRASRHSPVTVDVNHGDVVWDGRHATIVDVD